MTTTSTNTPPHPAYGLADVTRWTILRDAEIFGVKGAAEVHGVSDTAIYNWRKRLNWKGDTR